MKKDARLTNNKPILDACCGGKMFWFDRNNPNTVFVDKRTMAKQVIWRSKDGKETREFEVKPDVVADFQNLPFDDNSFYHVVFDPPHLTSAGETSWLAKKYGRLTDDWREMIKKRLQRVHEGLETLRHTYLQVERRGHQGFGDYQPLQSAAIIRTQKRQRWENHLARVYEISIIV